MGYRQSNVRTGSYRKYLPSVLVALLVVTAAPVVHAADEEGVRVEARLSPPVSPFFRKGEYTLMIEAPVSANVEMPKLDIKGEGLTVTPGQPVTEKVDEEHVRLAQTYVL